MLKRVSIMLFCLMMVFIATFGFVVGVVAVPTIYSYAAVDDDSIYVPLRDPSDAVIAFQAYCKSRDLTIEGSLTDAVTTFTTGAFNSACNEIGINISQLQAEIKAEYDSSGKPVKFLLNDTGVMAMNRVFAQFLQDNELSVGDSANQNDNTVYDGDVFTDFNGYSCLVYRFDTNPSFANLDSSNFITKGTYLYDYDYIMNHLLSEPFPDTTSRQNGSFSINLFGTSESVSFTRNGVKVNENYYYRYNYRISSNSNYYIRSRHVDGYNLPNANGGFIIYKVSDGGLRFGFLSHNLDTDKYYAYGYIVMQDNYQFTPAVVYLSTNNTVINNNVYEGDTIINNEGDVIVEPDPVPPGGTDPGWDIGGGGGTATDGNGNTWNIQFPDFELPDLNIDWSINGLGEKFPFSIPFDLVALVTVLNAEPQAPRFEGTVNFGFTTWDYDINLQQFDSVAQACRIAELLLLVVGLILVTRSIIKG